MRMVKILLLLCRIIIIHTYKSDIMIYIFSLAVQIKSMKYYRMLVAIFIMGLWNK